MPSAQINLAEVPAVEVQKLSRTFLSAVKRFYDDPRHVRDFEDWKRQVVFMDRAGMRGFSLKNGRALFYFGQKDLNKMDDADVIGNRWDNPELLGLYRIDTYYRSGFYGSPSAGVRAPWRSGDLCNGGNAGLTCANGNIAPSSAGWTGRPRLSYRGATVSTSATEVPNVPKLERSAAVLTGESPQNHVIPTPIRAVCRGHTVGQVVIFGVPALRLPVTRTALIIRKHFMLQRFNHIDHALCFRAVLKFLDKKWYRPDVQREIQCYAGIDFREMKEADRRGSLNVKLEIAEALAMEAENLLETVEEQGPEVLPELLDPVLVRKRKDGMTGKVRDIAYLCVWHQILEHIAVCALEPLFQARITPWQHASLPGHGDARLRKQVQRYLRSGLGIQYAVKMDVHHAYGSLQYSRVLTKIREDIPSGKQILTLLDALALMAPGGHLIIGGYLDAWLFNLAMGYAVEDVMQLSKTRRDKRVRLVIRPQVYMDDVCLLGSRLVDLKSAFRQMGRYIGQTFSLVWGPNITVTRFLTVQEEHRRKKAETRAGRGCPALDMGGWLFHRSYTTLRPRVYRMARRCAIRCNRDLRLTGTINWQRAQRYMQNVGMLSWQICFARMLSPGMDNL